ncbi:hypothetical protein FJZ18_00860 [Candidatus Pacearchaeota archaeon]|nr:hypothetical protein [Candidatus Pacearchaeota archaeon]
MHGCCNRFIALSTLVASMACSSSARGQEGKDQSSANLVTPTPYSRQLLLKNAKESTISVLFVDHLEQRYRENIGRKLTMEIDSEHQAKEFLSAAKKVAKDYIRSTEGYFFLREFAEEKVEWGLEKADWILDKILPDSLEARFRKSLHLDSKKPLGIDLDTREERIGEELFDPWQERERLYRTTLGIGMRPSITFRSGDLKLKLYHDKLRLELDHDMPHNIIAKLGAQVSYDSWELPEPYFRISKWFTWGELGIGAAKSDARGVDIGVYIAARY